MKTNSINIIITFSSLFLPGFCPIYSRLHSVITECNQYYDTASEEKGSYNVGWKPLGANKNKSSILEEYRYTSAEELNGFSFWGSESTFGGGGYVLRLRGSGEYMLNRMEELESEGWIDRYTRAVFVEFSVYNPQVNLFIVATILGEFLPDGSILPYYRFNTANLLPHMNSSLAFQIICEVVFLIFTISFLVSETRALRRAKFEYFTQFWSLVEFTICFNSLFATVVFFYRMHVTTMITKRFKESHGNEYMKLQTCSYWDEVFTITISWLVFLASLKFLKLLRFNKRMSILSMTLRNAAKDLLYISLIFLCIFLAFIQLFYLVFATNIPAFKTFVTSLESGILMMMGKFDVYAMLMLEPVLTQISIFFFVVTVTFIIVNIFISILNEAFAAVRNDVAKQSNDYEIIDFMISQLKVWAGMKNQDSKKEDPDSEEGRLTALEKKLKKKMEQLEQNVERLCGNSGNMSPEDRMFLKSAMRIRDMVESRNSDTLY